MPARKANTSNGQDQTGLKDDAIIAAEVATLDGTFFVVADDENINSHAVYFAPTGVSDIHDSRITEVFNRVTLSLALQHLSADKRTHLNGLGGDEPAKPARKAPAKKATTATKPAVAAKATPRKRPAPRNAVAKAVTAKRTRRAPAK